jgi:dTDP-4-amino-4,6-dideoxygalactose transaminase
LKKNGVQTLIHYPIPPHKQKCYAGEWNKLSLPIAERLAQQELSLPISQVMMEKDMRTIVNVINEFG